MSDHVADRAEARLAEGRLLLEDGQALVQTGEAADAEPPLRAALVSLRSAMDWFEAADLSERFEIAHGLLHEAGHLVRAECGCTVFQDGSSYFQTCPAALAHVRVGFSVAAIAQRIECSICHAEVAGCPHIKGRIYDGQRCFHEVKQLQVDHVALVTRPAMPDARIVKQSIDLSDLQQALGASFQPGMPVSCDRCLEACTGIANPAMGH